MDDIPPPSRPHPYASYKDRNKPRESDNPPSFTTAPYKLVVIRVPCSNLRTDEIHEVEIPLVKVDIRKDEYKDCTDLEIQLGSIPNIRGSQYKKNFRWSHRTLIRLAARQLGAYGEEKDQDYLMYTCTDPKSKLPRNEYLEKLGQCSDVPVYGDAFIFNMVPWLDEADESRGAGARWVHMNHFAAPAVRGYGRAANVLYMLLRSLPKPKKNGEV